MLSRIEELEQKQDKLHAIINNSSLYRKDVDKVTAVQNELITLKQEIASTYKDWEILEYDKKYRDDG